MRFLAFEYLPDGLRYKYRLTSSHSEVLPEVPVDARAAITPWVVLEKGRITFAKGYAWDGASGAVDTPSSLLPSLVHDGGYQIIAADLLPIKPWKKRFDLAFYRLCRECGMSWVRANYHYWAVRVFGGAKETYHPLPDHVLMRAKKALGIGNK